MPTGGQSGTSAVNFVADCGKVAPTGHVCTVPSSEAHNIHESWDVPGMWLASPFFNKRANFAAAWIDGLPASTVIRSFRDYANQVVRGLMSSPGLLTAAAPGPITLHPGPAAPPPPVPVNTSGTVRTAGQGSAGSTSGGQSAPTSGQVVPGGQAPVAPTPSYVTKPPTKGMPIPDGIDYSGWYHPDYD